MGCGQSKIENEESVSRCRERRNFMKEAVAARNAFAAGHSGYAMAMKNTGAALSDYAHGEAHNPITDPLLIHPAGSSTPLPPMMETTLPPPPPPLPSFSPVTPLQRSVTMPEFSVTKNLKKMKSVAIAEDEEDEESDDINDDLDLRKNRNKATGGPSRPKYSMRTPEPPPPPELKGMAWDYFFMANNMETNEENEENEEDDYEETFHKVEEAEPKTPVRIPEMTDTEDDVTPVTMDKQFLHSKTAPPDIRREMGKDGGKIGPSVDLLKILGDIDDHFLKASEAAQEVSKLLEATRMHYHSNFADNRGHIDHAARVMQVITWNRSFRGAPGSEGLNNNDFDAEEYETHATVLDKLLAWEKKLYEEVKAGETIKLEYQRKVAVLGKLKKRSASFESLEKTKAAVTHLHTKYIVDMQSLDSTVAEVNHIRDDQLYPKLVALVNGMSQMWESLCIHHDNQLTIVTELKYLEISGTPKETTKHHHDRTIQLFNVIQEWQSQFEKLVTNQKHYLQALNSWLKLNLIPIESSLREKVSSPPRTQNPPIQPLLHTWHDYLEKLPDELAKSAIVSFGAVIKTIILHQEEEMKLKEKCEETKKEYFRKSQAFDDWYQKYMQKRTPNDEADPNEGTNPQVSERQFLVESLKKRLEEENEAHQKHCTQVRDKSLQSLKIRLPELFRAMSDYSHACVDAYKKLCAVAQSQNVNDLWCEMGLTVVSKAGPKRRQNVGYDESFVPLWHFQFQEM